MDYITTPILANALDFAFKQATTEGKITICALVIVSIFSWTVIITKSRQLIIARKAARKFFKLYRETRDPMEIFRRGDTCDGAPAYELYATGAEEAEYHLKHNPVNINGQVRISSSSFENVKVAIERAASMQAMSLEKGMIILSTAVAGGPFIGLLGTVWGVMETFSGVAIAKSASLTAMAPGVAGALIATVVGLLVAIPAMFSYNYMVTTIRAITQELDAFASEFATQLEHGYVDNRPLAEEIRDALQGVSIAQRPAATQTAGHTGHAAPQPALAR
jgi:biopolymer transport protein ExbB/TolQ